MFIDLPRNELGVYLPGHKDIGVYLPKPFDLEAESVRKLPTFDVSTFKSRCCVFSRTSTLCRSRTREMWKVFWKSLEVQGLPIPDGNSNFKAKTDLVGRHPEVEAANCEVEDVIKTNEGSERCDRLFR